MARSLQVYVLEDCYGGKQFDPHLTLFSKMISNLLIKPPINLGALHTTAIMSRGPCTNSPQEDKVEVH
jgi:hypothetical protein